MAIETAADEAAPKEEAPKKDIGPKVAGPLERATELFMISGFSFVGYVLWTGDLDLSKQFLFVGLFLVLSLIGGVLSNVTYKAPPEKEAAPPAA